MKELLHSKQFDAVFVGTGAPRGKEPKPPRRYDSENTHTGTHPPGTPVADLPRKRKSGRLG